MKHFFLICFLIANIGFGQTQSTTIYLPSGNQQAQKSSTAMEQMYRSRSILADAQITQILEAQLESQHYQIGPGDIFNLIIFDRADTGFRFIVSPEGNVMIPTIGAYHIAGLSLKEAKEYLNTKISIFYDNSDFALNLDQLRKFRVYFTGEVKAPGTYFVQGTDRLADVLEASIVNAKFPDEVSASLTDWADNSRIEIRHRDSTIDVYDISRFYREGDEGQNPYLRGGDVIYVPSIDLSLNYTIIEGNIGFQGVYALKKNETLFSFLTRVSALNKKSNLQNIVLIRNGKKQVLDLLNDPVIRDSLRLKSGDKIIIPTIYEKVYVRGEVKRPGALPYKANYTAKDYIGEAGAMDSADDMSAILVLRQNGDTIATGPDVIIQKGDTIILPRRAREVVKDYIRILVPIISLGISVYSLISR